MFRQYFKDEQWRIYGIITRLHTYKTYLDKIVKSYEPYHTLIKNYSRKSGRNVFPISIDYLTSYPEITLRNISLLKNAIQLWQDASETSDGVAPVLYHYSLHCFISFFIYTFFRWEPRYARSHGISIVNWDENIHNIEIRITGRGIFQRFIDTWVLLGNYVAFSKFIPIYESGQIIFIENENYLLQDSTNLTLQRLLEFNPRDFERFIQEKLGNNIIKCPYMSSPITQTNYDLKSYLILFISSSIARYRPLLWESILIGETSEQSEFSLESTRAVTNLTSNNLLRNVYGILQEFYNEKFELKS